MKLNFVLSACVYEAYENIINSSEEKLNEHMFNILFLMESSFWAGALLWLLRKFERKLANSKAATKTMEIKLGTLWLIERYCDTSFKTKVIPNSWRDIVCGYLPSNDAQQIRLPVC